MLRLVAASSLLLSACLASTHTGSQPGSVPGQSPISHVELIINGVSKSDAEALRAQILAQGDILEVVLKSYAVSSKTATYELDMKGCECDLPAKISKIKMLGFKYEGRTSQITYKAFDNKPPEITFTHPENGRVLSEADQVVMVEVKDSDLDWVEIDGKKAENYRGDTYLVRLSLPSGEKEIKAVARDLAGNENVATTKVTVRISSDPNITVRVLVEGRTDPSNTVYIEGQEVPVDSKGKYRSEVAVPKGRKEIEVISVSKDGKKTVTVKKLSD